jgi:hypothetical protein
MDKIETRLPHNSVAFVMDGEVTEILYVNEKIFSLLTSDPLIVDVTGLTVDLGGIVQRGTLYDYPTKTFIPKAEIN